MASAATYTLYTAVRSPAQLPTVPYSCREHGGTVLPGQAKSAFKQGSGVRRPCLEADYTDKSH